ncbi:class I SAM-dependent methyltransferase [Methanosalsum natronophilum]|nr:class I SAM-dependent methyltransferase family protein [Methanosalsum natronophilum]MCS3923440.1 tRNA (guanine37-N1)-methyltransferase [Methanosalsum natronophilum]
MKKIKTIVEENVPDEFQSLVPKRFDLIGDILILKIPSELEDIKLKLAKAILIENNNNIKVVANKVTKVCREERVCKYEIIEGNRLTTIHRENGHKYKIDIEKVFFNNRLSDERLRVFKQIQPKENIVIPFSGVGPFAIPPAVNSKITAIDSNIWACELLKYNSSLNKVDENLKVINGNAFSINKMFTHKFDRAIVPTPYGKDCFLNVVLKSVKLGGHIHFYTFKSQKEIRNLVKDYENLGLEIIYYKKCGNIAPGISRWVFDLVKKH